MCVCSYVLLECRCEASRDAAQLAAEIYDESVSVPFQTALTVFARRQGPLDGRMQLFCTTADRPAGRALDRRDDYVRVATLHDVEVRHSSISRDSCITTSVVSPGKVLPYSFPSVGPRADPGVLAVSPQVA